MLDKQISGNNRSPIDSAHIDIPLYKDSSTGVDMDKVIIQNEAKERIY